MPSSRPDAARGLYGLAAAHSSSSILRSWERCSAMAPTLHADPNPIPNPELNARREQHAQILETAKPELDTLAGLVTGARGVVLLADPDGLILQEAGNTDFLRKAERVALRPGVSWAESIRGTNAIGTALYEGAAVRVHGSEHFLRCNRILSCHAAPIFSPRGEIMGVLDISSEAGSLQDYALGLAQLCARQIGNRLLDTADGSLHRLVFQRQSSLLESPERAIVLLQDDHIVGANEAALQLLRSDWSLLHRSIAAWIEDWSGLNEKPKNIRTADGVALVATLRRSRSAVARPLAASGAAQAVRSAPADATGPETQSYDLGSTASASLRPAVDALNAGLAVLLQGETGAGKEIFARRLHAQSRYRSGPFVAVNCGALPESLIEAELFGYEGGAFTGARREGSLGRLREAHGGVLFLDEIGDMPLVLQTRLLRALQEREVQPLGSNKRIPVDFALLSATNQDLAAMRQNGGFRADLFYRLQDYQVALAPLRERSDLRDFLCREFGRLGGVDRNMSLSDAALDVLAHHAWPGNYREMRAILRSLLFLKQPGSILHATDLPPALHPPPTGSGARTGAIPASVQATLLRTAERPAGRLRELNAQLIGRVLDECGNNVSHAAGVLGIHRSTLHRYLARHEEARAKLASAQ